MKYKIRPHMRSTIFLSLFLISVLSFAFTKSDVYRELARSQRLINEVYKSLITRYADRLDTEKFTKIVICLLYTSPSPRDLSTSRMPSSA